MEVEGAVGQVRELLGNDVKIILLGHSRGGLAARAFLQKHNFTPDSSNIDKVVALITTGTPHLGSPFGRVFKYFQANCPKSKDEYLSYTNFGGSCEDDWEAANNLRFQTGGTLDVSVPSIDFLSDQSSELQSLNRGVSNLSGLKFIQLVYTGKKFGNITPFYNPLPSVNNLSQYAAFLVATRLGIPVVPASSLLDQVSSDAETYILGTGTILSYVGDGIVPLNNQKITSITGFNLPTMTNPGNVVIPLNSIGDGAPYTGVYHAGTDAYAAETNQVTHINNALQALYNQLNW
jgi:hypothetical protein